MRFKEMLQQLDPKAGWTLDPYGCIRDAEQRCPIEHALGMGAHSISSIKSWDGFFPDRQGWSIIHAADHPLFYLGYRRNRVLRKALLQRLHLEEIPNPGELQ